MHSCKYISHPPTLSDMSWEMIGTCSTSLYVDGAFLEGSQGLLVGRFLLLDLVHKLGGEQHWTPAGGRFPPPPVYLDTIYSQLLL